MSATVAGSGVARIVLEVSGDDIASPLVFNLEVADDVAAGVVSLPVGRARTITARAHDPLGEITHEGSATIDVVPGTNPTLSIVMVPRAGAVPIVVVVGTVTVVLSPASLSLTTGETAWISASVTSADGTPLSLPVTWASTAPNVAVVDAAGLVEGRSAGDAIVVATSAGSAAVATIRVTQGAAAVATPTLAPAGGVFASARTVTIASGTPGATIHFTTDGSLPTAASPAYVAPVTVPSTRVVKALARAPGLSDSAVATGVYVVESGGTTLNGHTLVTDAETRLLSWLPQPHAFAAVVDRTWNALLHQLPVHAPSGLSLFLLYPYVVPGSYAAPNWPNAPGSSVAMLVDSALLSYPFTGDPAVLAFAKRAADHYLLNGMTAATDAWAGVPYAEGDPGSSTYRGANDVAFGAAGIGDGIGVLEPDKVAELGYAFLRLHEWDGTIAYREAAIRCADALVLHRVTATGVSVSPWPFRVYAASGAVREAYTAHVLPAIQLFDELIRLGLGDTVGYATARAAAWTWLLARPMTNGKWAQYFEDIRIQETYDANPNQLIPGNTARHLLERPSLDPSWETHARSLVAWIETRFGKAAVAGATPIGEQAAYDLAMGSHTSRYGAVNALLFARTGDPAAKEKAFRALNWATYMNRADGVTLDGHPQPNQVWMTDSFGDYVRHFMIAMAAIPEWAPPGEDHLLGSTSVVQSVSYARRQVSYRTFDAAGEETLRLTFTPTAITADGSPLSQRGDLDAEGFTWDAVNRVLRIRRDGARDVAVR